MSAPIYKPHTSLTNVFDPLFYRGLIKPTRFELICAGVEPDERIRPPDRQPPICSYLVNQLDPRNNPMNLAHWDVSDIRASVLWPHRYDPGPV